MIVLNAREVAFDILDKKGAIYSERPVLQIAGERLGWNVISAFLPYGKELRTHRKHFSQLLGTNASIKRFHPIQEDEARRFAQCLLRSPNDLFQHIHQYACHHYTYLHVDGSFTSYARAVASSLVRLAYGYDGCSNDARLFKLVKDGMDEFSQVLAPGAFLSDIMPIRE